MAVGYAKTIARGIACCCMTLLMSCASRPELHNNCVTESDQAWKELSIAKAKGFAGTISYAQALSLLTAARTMQFTDNYESCQKNAKKARIYIANSYKGK